MDKTKMAVAVFNKLAARYQEKFMDVSLYSDTLDLFCDAVNTQGATILELACGPGNITKHLLNKRPDFKILGTDLAPNMIELAKINNPMASFQIMDCRDIGILSKKYDALMCGFCLPYLSKEESIKLISDASDILNPNGIIYVSTMEDDYTKSDFKKGSSGDEIYMHYHQADYLSSALENSGFNILTLKRQDFPSPEGEKTTDLILIAQKR
jgi:2-polyprenyl-3-methyl-5-hydroxy-6-metoxy-1,4-benzoquinol methylase